MDNYEFRLEAKNLKIENEWKRKEEIIKKTNEKLDKEMELFRNDKGKYENVSFDERYKLFEEETEKLFQEWKEASEKYLTLYKEKLKEAL